MGPGPREWKLQPTAHWASVSHCPHDPPHKRHAGRQVGASRGQDLRKQGCCWNSRSQDAPLGHADNSQCWTRTRMTGVTPACTEILQPKSWMQTEKDLSLGQGVGGTPPPAPGLAHETQPSHQGSGHRGRARTGPASTRFALGASGLHRASGRGLEGPMLLRQAPPCRHSPRCQAAEGPGRLPTHTLCWVSWLDIRAQRLTC